MRAFFAALVGALVKWMFDKMFLSKERKVGRLEAEREHVERQLEDSLEVRRARDRLRRDPAFKRRMRDKYTRDG